MEKVLAKKICLETVICNGMCIMNRESWKQLRISMDENLFHLVETTGEPAEVVITPYKTTMLADGKDATVINVSVIDKQGREVPDADNLIQFFVKWRCENYRRWQWRSKQP